MSSILPNPRFGLLSCPGSVNLGDAIQSLAARRFLPRVDLRLPRELLSQAPEGAGPDPDGPIRAIFNGWFMDRPWNWPPHPQIAPLLVSMHFADGYPGRRWPWSRSIETHMFTPEGIAFLLRHGPVGTRDLASLELLDRHGVAGYHSGCLTLTLEPRSGVERGGHIVATDVPEPALAHLRHQAGGRLVAISHQCVSPLAVEEQDLRAAALLDLYAGAAAVVTTRIHAALPCLALGTPVLLLLPAAAPRRVTDMTALMHHASLADFIAGRHDFDPVNPPANPEAFRPLAQTLEARCRAYVAETEVTGASLPSASA